LYTSSIDTKFPGAVPDLQKSDFTRLDFSISDFTNSCLKECDFTKCVMLFAELAQAKISASQFCYDTLVRGNNSVEMKVDDCEGTKTSLLHSNISDSQCLDPGEPSTSGNFSDETKISNAIPGNMGNLNYRKYK
jgi:uncharacterized protein YjbI with pentapeptide repeats